MLGLPRFQKIRTAKDFGHFLAKVEGPGVAAGGPPGPLCSENTGLLGSSEGHDRRHTALPSMPLMGLGTRSCIFPWKPHFSSV